MKDSGQVKLQVFPGATAENQSNFLCVKPFDKSETEIFWNYMKSKFPNPNAYVNDLTFDQIFKLTGCVPRHIKSITNFTRGILQFGIIYSNFIRSLHG